MRYVQLTLALSASFFLHGYVAADEPCLILVDTGEYSRHWKAYRLDAIKRYGLEKRLSPEQKEYYAAPPYYSFQGEQAEEQPTGMAYYVRTSSDVEKYRFKLVKNESVYEQFVADELARRGEEATVVGTGRKRTLKAPPYIQTVPQRDGTTRKVTVNRGDFRIAYAEGILAYGQTAHDAPLANIRRHVRAAKGSHWYLRYRPMQVPKKWRAALLKEIQKSTGVSFQQLDNEADVAHQMRRSIGESYFELIRAMLFDVEEITAWSKLPKGRDGYKFRVMIKARQKSELAKLISELGPGRSIVVGQGENVIAQLLLNLTIPAKFRPVFHSIVENSPLAASAEAINQAIAMGHVAGAATLQENDSQNVMLTGRVQLDLGAENLAEVGKVLGGSHGPEPDSVNWPVSPEISNEKFGKHTLKVASVDRELLFVVAPADVVPKLQPPLLQRGQSRNRVLLRLSGDLSTWVRRDEDAPSSEIFGKLESIFMRSRGITREQMFARMMGQPEPVVEYTSLRANGPRDGDWSFAANLKTGRDTVTFDFTAGKELHDFVLVRSKFN